jgi:hypothetical protein
MNGRVYDPYTALFLSPDPYIQAPDFTQNYNRYAYVLNNPLKYTDPSGYNYKPIDWDKGSGGALYYIPFDPGIFGNPFRPYSFTSVDEVESYRDWSYLHGIGATNTSFSDYLAGGGIYELNGFNVRTYYRPWFYNTYTVDNGVTYSYTFLGGSDKYSGGTYVGQGGINLGNKALGQDDGYLTFSEAKAHYQFGGGTPVYVDINKIDLSNVSMNDFGKNGRALVKLDGKHFSNVNDAIVHGTITLQRIGDTNTATIAGQGYGMYNFEMHPWNSAFNIFVRNPGTIMGAIVNSLTIIQTPIPIVIPTGGTPYPIYYMGTTTINP